MRVTTNMTLSFKNCNVVLLVQMVSERITRDAAPNDGNFQSE
jgi:hypothetical protein